MRITKARLREIIKEELGAMAPTETKEKSPGFHACAAHVGLKETGEQGWVIPGTHTLLEDGSVTHYDVEFDNRIEENIPVDDLDIQETHNHGKREKEEEDKVEEVIDHSVGLEKTKRMLEGEALVRRTIPKSPYRRQGV
tara:strand:+ start:392 stop:808 length:417 start_codon:yes stop_codon:yes gene_type:complete